MNIDDWLANNRNKLDTEYELLFSRTVLSLVEGLLYTTQHNTLLSIGTEGSVIAISRSLNPRPYNWRWKWTVTISAGRAQECRTTISWIGNAGKRRSPHRAAMSCDLRTVMLGTVRSSVLSTFPTC